MSNNSNFKQYFKQYQTTKQWKAANLCNNYNNQDKEKGFDITNNIDSKWFIEHISNSACTFCGETDWHKLGADRIDNSKPHTADNVQCCCAECNRKKHLYSNEEFERMRKLCIEPIPRKENRIEFLGQMASKHGSISYFKSQWSIKPIKGWNIIYGN